MFSKAVGWRQRKVKVSLEVVPRQIFTAILASAPMPFEWCPLKTLSMAVWKIENAFSFSQLLKSLY